MNFLQDQLLNSLWNQWSSRWNQKYMEFWVRRLCVKNPIMVLWLGILCPQVSAVLNDLIRGCSWDVVKVRTGSCKVMAEVYPDRPFTVRLCRWKCLREGICGFALPSVFPTMSTVGYHRRTSWTAHHSSYTTDALTSVSHLWHLCSASLKDVVTLTSDAPVWLQVMMAATRTRWVCVCLICCATCSQLLCSVRARPRQHVVSLVSRLQFWESCYICWNNLLSPNT